MPYSGLDQSRRIGKLPLSGGPAVDNGATLEDPRAGDRTELSEALTLLCVLPTWALAHGLPSPLSRGPPGSFEEP
jgi:hypothetical protein